MSRMVDPIPKTSTGFGLNRKRRGLRPVGKKGRARTQAMQQVPLGGPCEAQLDVCTGTAEHRHHIRRRSQGGTDDRSNLALLCGRCHAWVHANPREARTLGLLRFGVDNMDGQP